NDYEVSLERLVDVMGVPPGTPMTLQEVKLALVPIPIDDDQLVQAASGASPAIQAEEVAVRQGKLRLRVARNGLLPALDASAAYTKTYNTRTGAGLMFEPAQWSGTLRLQYQLFNRDAGGTAEIARVDLVQRQDRLAAQRRQVALQVRIAARTARS